MISFYPGPSKVYPAIPQYVREAYDQGVLSINHRSAEFVEISRKTVRLLHQRLQIPEDYRIFFPASATECWEIISQSLVAQRSYHLYNGAFGAKWFSYAQQLQPEATAYSFSPQTPIDTALLTPPPGTELIALTHNETANGTAVAQATLAAIRQQFPDQLIAVDATSSMAGVALDLAQADVWYASVQKCFGLPAGMAVLVCSPRAVQRAQELAEARHYNSLTYMIREMERWQTTHTPNVMNIYLLMRTLEERPLIEQTEQMLQQRYHAWVALVETLPYVSLLIHNPEVRSRTVIALEAAPAVINELRQAAADAGIVLGNGYGDLKPTTLRIANFPALEADEIALLESFLLSFAPSS